MSDHQRIFTGATRPEWNLKSEAEQGNDRKQVRKEVAADIERRGLIWHLFGHLNKEYSTAKKSQEQILNVEEA